MCCLKDPNPCICLNKFTGKKLTLNQVSYVFYFCYWQFRTENLSNKLDYCYLLYDDTSHWLLQTVSWLAGHLVSHGLPRVIYCWDILVYSARRENEWHILFCSFLRSFYFCIYSVLSSNPIFSLFVMWSSVVKLNDNLLWRRPQVLKTDSLYLYLIFALIVKEATLYIF